VKKIAETKKDNAEISNKKKNIISFALYQRFFYAIFFFVLLLEFLVRDESRKNDGKVAFPAGVAQDSGVTGYLGVCG
jgi:hypothetical protein